MLLQFLLLSVQLLVVRGWLWHEAGSLPIEFRIIQLAGELAGECRRTTYNASDHFWGLRRGSSQSVRGSRGRDWTLHRECGRKRTKMERNKRV